MTNFIDTLKDRRSIRKYKTDDISDDHLNQLLEAVQCSQSWSNTQVWELIIIKDPAVKSKIKETIPGKNPSFMAVEQAPVLFALCGKTKTSGRINGEPGSKPGEAWMMYDLGLATQNLCNAAHALGLGTVVVGWFDHDKAADILGLPEGYELVSLISAGNPDQKGSSPKRREIKDFTHENVFKK